MFRPLKRQRLVSIPTAFIIIVAFIVTFNGSRDVGAQTDEPANITIEVGRRSCRKPDKRVEPNVRSTVSNPSVATASFDPATQVFCVMGRAVGQTRVVFSGSYSGSGGGGGGMLGGLQGGAQRLNKVLMVTVVARRVEEAPAAASINVELGKTKDLAIETILGSEFAKPEDNGSKWRDIVLTEGDVSIVRVDLVDNDRLKVRLRGIEAGKTRFTLQGELFRDNKWETVARTFEVSVTKGQVTPEPADPWLDALQRRLAELKAAAARAGENEPKIQSSIRDFSNFRTLLSNALTNERRRAEPREVREAKIENLRDETDNETQKLKDRFNQIVLRPRTIDWYDDFRELNIVLVDLPMRRIFICPPNPGNVFSSAGVYGTDRYLNISTICTAALHAGVITARSGGTFTVEFHKGSKGDKYIGSKRNGFTSTSWERDWGWFVFVR